MQNQSDRNYIEIPLCLLDHSDRYYIEVSCFALTMNELLHVDFERNLVDLLLNYEESRREV